MLSGLLKCHQVMRTFFFLFSASNAWCVSIDFSKHYANVDVYLLSVKLHILTYFLAVKSVHMQDLCMALLL